jgi:hypothetical protein
MARRSKTDDFPFEGFESPNTTPVPDVVFDQFLSKLGEAELKALLYIIRRTFGFKKDRDPISFNQFLRGITTREGHVLDHGCGIKDRTTLSKALKSLEEKGIVLSEKGVDERGENVTTVYSLRFKNSNALGVVGNSYHPSMNNPPPVVGSSYPQETVLQQTDINTSNTRESSPKKKKTDETAKFNPQPQPAQPAVSIAEFTDPQPTTVEQPPEPATESREAASPAQPPLPTQPPGLSRSYLNQVRATTRAESPVAGGMTAISSLIPTPQPTARPTATEAWQVLVDLLSDISREFRDEAKLTESVSRAYNLMQQAKITDIGVFTAKIYEARAITKSRYATVKRRMPYFYSVLADVCRLRPKPPGQTPASGQQS